MLFNSYEFIFLYLPITVAAFFALARFGGAAAAAAWLTLASLAFYGYWNIAYIGLLLASIVVNYWFGMRIVAAQTATNVPLARTLLAVAITANLMALGYFKYLNFLVDTLSALTAREIDIARVVLPIGISFFTFTQIAYLVDTYQRKVTETNFIHYVLFVSYFPHLIAGPVLHHAEMMPQFGRKETYRFNAQNFAVGCLIFAIGLFKKVVIADGIQPYVSPVLDAPPGTPLTALEAWGGALAYTMQLYFDFSGYSDMAIGLSKMVNIDLPLNFNSPYKAVNIVDFWRRWHMTLSRFLRDYLYVPLGGNRLGRARRYINLMVTMLLGGLWHGASWTFVFWGGLHGFYLVVNHAWEMLRKRLHIPTAGRYGRALALLVTFIAVVIGWVFFRAKSFPIALNVLQGMAGFNGWIPAGDQSVFDATRMIHFGGAHQLIWLAALLAIVWFLPNTQEVVPRLSAWMSRGALLGERRRYLMLGGLGVSVVLMAIINASRGVSEFIYFNF